MTDRPETTDRLEPDADVEASPVASSPVTPNQRHHFVDALRGFALLGILVVNIEYIVQPASLGWSGYDTPVDEAVRWFITSFAQTKIYPIFATLFGYGLALQFDRIEAGGDDAFVRRSRRRNSALLILGVVHGTLFFPGDILALYAIVGALCLRFRTWSSAKLVRMAAWVYGIAAAVWLTLGVLDTLGGGSTFTSPPDPSDFEVLQSGSFADVVAVHIPDWIETFLFLVVLQGPAVVASFAVGIALGRTSLLSDPASHRAKALRFLRTWAPVGFVVAGLAGWASIASIKTETLGFAVGFAVAPVISASYLAILGLTIGVKRNAVAKVLQMAGSMSLTVYLAESIVATTLAYGYGAGWVGRVGPLEGLGLAVAIWLALSLAARTWMSRFRFGPTEWALRSFTYNRRQPLPRRTTPR